MSIAIKTPVTAEVIRKLRIGDQLDISGIIYTARDAALPLLIDALKKHKENSLADIELAGAIIFHTAVSRAGIGPTTSNKVEIEESMPILSQMGVKIHIGKGAISDKTIKALSVSGGIFAVTPPISALLTDNIVSQRVVAFPEEGIEAIHELKVKDFPAIVACTKGESIY